MSLTFTLNKAPVTPDLKDACGLPFAAVVQPFAPGHQEEVVPAADISRCHECYAYICKQCAFQRTGWVCALCGTLNEYHSLHNQRYLDVEERGSFAELRSDTVEAACSLLPGDPDEAHGEGEEQEELFEVEAQPLYLAVVDTCCGPDFLEVVRSALLAALEAMPPCALFGLISVGEEVGLHEALEGGPAVRFVPVLPTGPDPTTVELQEALPLSELLAPVGTAKEAIVAMLEALVPAAPPAGTEDQAPTRAVGSAVQAVLRYLGSAAAEQRATPADDGTGGSAQDVRWRAAYTGARLMLFLSGPPTHGRGSVVAPRPPPSGSDKPRVELQPLLLDPVFPELTAWTTSEMREEAQRAQQAQRAAQQTGSPMAAAAADKELGEEVAIDLSHAAAPQGGSSEVQLVVNWEATQFYEEAGVAAAALGVCVDLYALCPHFVGLDLLHPLAARSGGAVRLYPTPEDAALPQDVYKRLCTPHAFGCLLRLRASPELRVAPRCHGNAWPDPHYANLFRIPACGPADTFALDVRHVARDGLAAPGAGTPVVQLVFQYSVLAPAAAAAAAEGEEGGEGGGGKPEGRHYVLRRRLRVTTVGLGIAATPLQLYTSCDAPATATVLMHKVLAAAAAEGSLQAARALLREWLAALAASSCAVLASEDAQLAEAAAKRRGAAGATGEEPAAGNGKQVDASFASLEALQPLPRLVYGLLASPLLRPPAPGRHPDAGCALGALWGRLPPAELACAIYPQLSSWASPDELAFPRHSLSRAAVELSGQPLFLLDAYSELVVYYNPRARAGSAVPFPPPQGSELRSAVNALRASRAVLPRLSMVQEGTGNTDVFWRRMIDDGSPEDPDLPRFLDFLQLVESEALEML